MDNWHDTCAPCLDPDSTLVAHNGRSRIAPFQTHSRFFYAPLGEHCCGIHFVELFYQQYHPFPHCSDCARLVLGNASHICWQCRTYFRRYSTGMMQQVMGVTPQRHNLSAILSPARGPNQQRLPEEEVAQDWRDQCLDLIRLPILQVLLPQPTQCPFWIRVCTHLRQFGDNPILVNLPTVPMPFYDNASLLPLPPNPFLGFSSFSSAPEEIIIDPSAEVEDVPPP